MASTRISRLVKAPRESIYRALLDPSAIQRWKLPNGMSCQAQVRRPHRGAYHGRFVKLVPHTGVVEVDEFETPDPALRGEMTITIRLADAERPPPRRERPT